MKNLKISFAQVWGLICVSHYKGEETSQFLIDRSLMRPRNLLKLVGYWRLFTHDLAVDRLFGRDCPLKTAGFSILFCYQQEIDS